MKHRSLAAVIFFSIITLGIYDIFWLVSTKKVLNERTQVHVPTIWVLFLPVVILFVAFGMMMAVMGSGSATGSVIALIIELVAFVAIIPITFYWFFKYSKAVSQFTGGRLNTAVTFLLLWLIRFIGIAIIQDEFNGMQEGDMPQQPLAAAPLAPVAPVAPLYGQTLPQQPVDQQPAQPQMAAFMNDVTPPAVPQQPQAAAYAAAPVEPIAPTQSATPIEPVLAPVPVAVVEQPVAEPVAVAVEQSPEPAVAPQLASVSEPPVDPYAPVIIKPEVSADTTDESTPPVTPWQPPTNPTA